MTDREKFEQICDLTTEIVGLRQGDLALDIRTHKYLIPRKVATVIGRMIKDIHSEIIADIIKKDRTTVLHYMNKHQVDYKSFPLYRDTFNKVYAAYDKSEKIKLVFFENEIMARYLLNAGIKIVAKPQLRIKVISGKCKYLVPTNYLDFSNNINIINNSLKEYDYSTEIITL